MGYLAATVAMLANVACQVILSGVFRRAGSANEAGNAFGLIRPLFLDPLFWIGCAAAALMLTAWSFALGQLPLAKILPIMALLFLVSPLLAWLVYGERLSPINIAGYAVLTVGVVLSAWK